MDIYIYSRKSVYTGKGESVENQVEMCKAYLAERLPEAEKASITVYEDEGFSAKNTNRPRFQQMLRDLRLHKPDYLVCYRLDRISRNVSDFTSLIEELNRNEISFLCIREEFDTSKPMGKAMMYMASVFAQLERETIAERVRDHMRMLARTGRWLGGTAPTGFSSEPTVEIRADGKPATCCMLRENPQESKIVDAIFEKFLELRSLSGVARFLMQQGFRSRTGKPFSRTGVKEILQNPVYCIADTHAWEYFTKQHSNVCFEKNECSKTFGLLAYNKRDYRQKNAKRQAMDQWIVAIGRHPGRISGKKWGQIQTLLRGNPPKSSCTHNAYALLSGWIVCGKCHNLMFAKPRKNQGQYDYICNKKLRDGTTACSCQNLSGPQTDRDVWEALLPYFDPSGVSWDILKKRALLDLLVEKVVWDEPELHLFLKQ